jgi:hypothetical protein
MSGVNKPNNGNNPMSSAFEKAGVAQPQSAYQAPPQDTSKETSGIMGLNTRMSRPMARSSSSEQVQRFEAVIKNIIETSISPANQKYYDLVVMDNNRHQIAFSTVLLIHKAKDTKNLTVFSYLIEGSSTKLNNRIDNIGGQQVEVEIVTGDVYNQPSYWTQVLQVVANTTGVNDPNLVNDAGCMVIDNDIDLTDNERMWDIVFNGVNACYTVLGGVLGLDAETFTVNQVSQQDQLVAVMDFSGDPVETVTGLPVRSDVKLSLRGTVQSNSTEVGIQQQREMTQICGYVDLIFERAQPQQQQFPGQMQQPMDTRSYLPRFVITKMASMLDGESLELQLLALSTSTLLATNNSWAGVFKPRYLENDLRDIGAVGYEVNLTGDPNQKPERINTKSDSFDNSKLYQLISTTIQDNLVYSMDIEEVGELSWMHNMFLDAASGAPNAVNAIIKAANKLTNNCFNNFWDGSQKICEHDSNRVHLGYYVDDKGEKRDIRDIDYLAVLNLVGKSNPQMVEEWESTFNQKNVDLSIRMDRRRKMLSALHSGRMEVKGFARRINFNPNFIIALSQANQQANLIIQPGNTLQEFGAQHVRGNSGYSNFAVHSQNLSGMFNTNQGPAQTGRFNQMYASRSSTWGK